MSGRPFRARPMSAADIVSHPFRRHPRTDTGPKFENPIACVRCSGSRYVGADYCPACDGCGQQEGPPPAPRPTIPLTAVDSELVAALQGLSDAHAAFGTAIGRAASAARAANQVAMARVLEQVSLASRGAGIVDHLAKLKQWATARLKVAGVTT